MKRIALIPAYASAPAKGKATTDTTAPTEAMTTKRVAPVLTEVGVVALPDRKTNRGGTTIYPFDKLTQVGSSFGIKDRDKKSVQGAVSNQNRKFKVPAKNDDGTVILDGNGKPKMTYSQHFEVIEVDSAIAEAIKGTHLDGSKVIVRRDV